MSGVAILLWTFIAGAVAGAMCLDLVLPRRRSTDDGGDA